MVSNFRDDNFKKWITFSALWVFMLIYPAAAFSDPDAGRTLTPADIEDSIKNYLTGHTPYAPDQIRVHNITIPVPVVLMPSWDYEVLPAPKSLLSGRTSFSVNIKSDGRDIQTYWVSANIEILVDAVLTSMTLKDNQVINEDDIYVSKKVLSEMPAGYIKDAKDVVGKRTKRFIGANRPITEDMIEYPPKFRRGDKVFIVAESDALRITAIGIASEDGIKGKPVRVINMQSRKEVFGEVSEDGVVRVRW